MIAPTQNSNNVAIPPLLVDNLPEIVTLFSGTLARYETLYISHTTRSSSVSNVTQAVQLCLREETVQLAEVFKELCEIAQSVNALYLTCHKNLVYLENILAAFYKNRIIVHNPALLQSPPKNISLMDLGSNLLRVKEEMERHKRLYNQALNKLKSLEEEYKTQSNLGISNESLVEEIMQQTEYANNLSVAFLQHKNSQNQLISEAYQLMVCCREQVSQLSFLVQQAKAMGALPPISVTEEINLSFQNLTLK